MENTISLSLSFSVFLQLRACNMTSQKRDKTDNVLTCKTEMFVYASLNNCWKIVRSGEWEWMAGKTFYVRIISNNHLWFLSAEQTHQQPYLSKSPFVGRVAALLDFVLLCDTVSFFYFSRCPPDSCYFLILYYFQCIQAMLFHSIKSRARAEFFFILRQFVKVRFGLTSVKH